MNEVIAWVELLGETLSGVDKPDGGLIWSDLEGWWGLPDSRGDGDLIPGGHGRFRRAEVLREARVITLKGHIYGADNRELVAVRDRLEAALSAGAGPMRVATSASGVWERWVEIDTLTIEPDHGRHETAFTVDMIAPDPRRYGPRLRVGPAGLPTSQGGVRFPQRAPFNCGSVASGGRLLIPNAGVIPVYPTIIVAGGFESVTVSDITAGRRLRLDWPVPEGEAAVFDSRARRVDLGKSEITRWLTRREWFKIPAGRTHEFRFEVSGGSGDPQMWGEYREGAW